MSLIKYTKKRNPKKSGEPKPKIKCFARKLISHEHKIKGNVTRRKPIRLPRFVIQKHQATNLHWDLRLEINGTLKSWALPKQPPKIKGLKRLAIQVEDHPLEYAKFHGIIPEGNYGAGEVRIWDNGEYELLEEDSKKIEFKLHGKKLKGNYVLIKTNYGNKKKGWLFFKI